MAILSFQSHVSYGYVGNRVATHILQSLGHEVWAVNTVNLSSHTGYKNWQGQIFSPEEIGAVVNGLKSLEVEARCQAVLSGYIGNGMTGEVILQAVEHFSSSNPQCVYLCDPVMGDKDKGFFVKEDSQAFFKRQALRASTIITPNHFEAEVLYGKKIRTIKEASLACQYFHDLGVQIVIITSFIFEDLPSSRLSTLLSTSQGCWLGLTDRLAMNPSGTGDLFSALYLGNFLNCLQLPLQAFIKTLHSVFDIIKNTYLLNRRELALLSFNPNLPLENDRIILEKVS